VGLGTSVGAVAGFFGGFVGAIGLPGSVGGRVTFDPLCGGLNGG
jgi:hypothetical protein